MIRCFFTGHREADENLMPRLCEAVEQHIREYGVTEFVVGHYGNFDRLAAKAVADAKKRHPEVALTLLLPYHPSEQKIEIPPVFDGTIYPEGLEKSPKRFAIVKANRYMVEHCDYLIAYVWHPASNSRKILEYAKARHAQGLLQGVTVLGQ